MIVPERLIAPPEDFAAAFPGRGFANRFTLHTAGEPLLVGDPTYLADVYGGRDPHADVVRRMGAFLLEFGGDGAWPVWWRAPYLLLPLSLHGPDEPQPPPGAIVLAEEIGVDSGSLLFLPDSAMLPATLRRSAERLVQARQLARLPVPAGRWTLYYEQHDPPQPNLAALYRNVVLRHTAAFPKNTP
jgi:hypothetical protein